MIAYLPKINLVAISRDIKNFLCWFNLNGRDQIQPPIIRSFIDAEIDKIRNTLLKLKYPCLNQSVKRHVKAVAKAPAHAVEFK